MKIEEKIKQIRLSKGASPELIAEKANIEINAYNDIESGKADLTFKELERIATALEYLVVDIITYQESTQGIRNYFYNHQGNKGTNIKIQGVDQEEIRKFYKDLFKHELGRITKLEKLLQENNIQFDF